MARKIKFPNKRMIIIESAGKLFDQYGYENVTICQIAKSAGIGKGTVYTEFKNKQEIMSAVLYQFVSDVNQHVKEVINQSKDTAINILKETQLQRILLHYNHVKNNFHGTELFTISLDKIKNHDKMHAESDNITAKLLKKAAANKEIVDLDDYLETAICIRKALVGFYPPMVFAYSNKEEIIDKSSRLLSLLLSGLIIK